MTSVFVFRTCESLDGPNEFRIDLFRVAGEPQISPHALPERVNLIIRFTDGSDSGLCLTSPSEAERFRAALAEFRAVKS